MPSDEIILMLSLTIFIIFLKILVITFYYDTHFSLFPSQPRYSCYANVYLKCLDRGHAKGVKS